MDYLRVLLVPFRLTSLILIALFSVLLALFGFGSGGLFGLFVQLFLQIWILNYC